MVAPPDLDRLREAQGKPIWPRYPSEGERRWLMAHVDALDFLLSLLDEGGRLVVEQPCEHGVFHDDCDQLVCGHERCGDGWYLDARAECWCPGGSRRVVWPTDKEEE